MSFKETNFDVVQGDTWDAYITLKNDSGLIDLTGYTFFMEVKNKPGGNVVCATASLNNGISVYDTGVIYVVLTPEQTSKFVIPTSKYQLISVDPQGRRKTVIQGFFQVESGTVSL